MNNYNIILNGNRYNLSHYFPYHITTYDWYLITLWLEEYYYPAKYIVTDKDCLLSEFLYFNKHKPDLIVSKYLHSSL